MVLNVQIPNLIRPLKVYERSNVLHFQQARKSRYSKIQPTVIPVKLDLGEAKSEKY